MAGAAGRDDPSRSKLPTDRATASHSGRDSRPPPSRTSNASSPTPPADAAWTSERGAKPSAAMYSAHPLRPVTKPASHCQFLKRLDSDERGWRGAKVGKVPDTACWR